MSEADFVKEGDFVWYELCTRNPSAAADFYAHVVGWAVRESGLPGVEYKLVCAGDRQIGGIMSLPEAQMPPRPAWLGYVATADVDAKAREIEAAGGRILKEPMDIPTVGRFAVAADKQGAVFMIFKGAGEAPPPPAPMQANTVGWHELHAKDIDASWAFYESLFGWRKEAALDMGPMGTYQLFKAGASSMGGMMNDAQAPHPYWLFYFVVDDIDAGLQRIAEKGGIALFGPREVPGGAWIVNAQDPQGGLFALVGMRQAA